MNRPYVFIGNNMILIIKHIDIEGPGTLGDFFKKQDEPFRIIELGAGEALPTDLNGIKAVVVLGGPMNVDEEDKYSFLSPENKFIKTVLKEEIPYLGICLGSQLLAKAAGARVVKSPLKEVGWYKIKLTDEGKEDPFLKGFQENEMIFHWHDDMFEIPQDARLLATGLGCPHQALRVGKNAYGIQFHVEITDASIKEWCHEYWRPHSSLSQHGGGIGRGKDKIKELLNGYTQYKKQFDLQAERLYQNFLRIANL